MCKRRGHAELTILKSLSPELNDDKTTCVSHRLNQAWAFKKQTKLELSTQIPTGTTLRKQS